jgi:hypothetical protein
MQADVNQAISFPWSNLITAVASVSAALGAVVLTQRYTQRRDRGISRREAYEAFIRALDGLDRIWVPLLPSGGNFDHQNTGSATNQAADQIQDAYIAVLLLGTARSRNNANVARQAAWKLSDRVKPASHQEAVVAPSFEQLKPLADGFRDARRAFIEAAAREFQ